MISDKVNCKDVMKHVCESLGEDLNSESCRNIRMHLEECQDCKNYFVSVEKTIEFYKEYNIDMPPDAHNRLMSCLGLQDESL
jgi:predicted anti-sigma-YlaC factor YlaD